ERVPRRAAGFTRVLPSDDHAAKRQRSDGVGDQQNGTAGPQHDNPGVGVVPAVPATDDEEIGRPCFAQEKLTGRLNGAAPSICLSERPWARNFLPLCSKRAVTF